MTVAHRQYFRLLDINYRHRPSLPVGSQIWSPCVPVPVGCLSRKLNEIQGSTSIFMPTRGAKTDGTTRDMDVVQTQSTGSRVRNIRRQSHQPYLMSLKVLWVSPMLSVPWIIFASSPNSSASHSTPLSYPCSVCRAILYQFEVVNLNPGIVNEPFVAQLDRNALETLWVVSGTTFET